MQVQYNLPRSPIQILNQTISRPYITSDVSTASPSSEFCRLCPSLSTLSHLYFSLPYHTCTHLPVPSFGARVYLNLHRRYHEIPYPEQAFTRASIPKPAVEGPSQRAYHQGSTHAQTSMEGNIGIREQKMETTISYFGDLLGYSPR